MGCRPAQAELLLYVRIKPRWHRKPRHQDHVISVTSHGWDWVAAPPEAANLGTWDYGDFTVHDVVLSSLSTYSKTTSPRTTGWILHQKASGRTLAPKVQAGKVNSPPSLRYQPGYRCGLPGQAAYSVSYNGKTAGRSGVGPFTGATWRPGRRSLMQRRWRIWIYRIRHVRVVDTEWRSLMMFEHPHGYPEWFFALCRHWCWSAPRVPALSIDQNRFHGISLNMRMFPVFSLSAVFTQAPKSHGNKALVENRLLWQFFYSAST